MKFEDFMSSYNLSIQTQDSFFKVHAKSYQKTQCLKEIIFLTYLNILASRKTGIFWLIQNGPNGWSRDFLLQGKNSNKGIFHLKQSLLFTLYLCTLIVIRGSLVSVQYLNVGQDKHKRESNVKQGKPWERMKQRTTENCVEKSYLF